MFFLVLRLKTRQRRTFTAEKPSFLMQKRLNRLNSPKTTTVKEIHNGVSASKLRLKDVSHVLGIVFKKSIQYNFLIQFHCLTIKYSGNTHYNIYHTSI
jgi:hypothetical protein